MIVQYLSAFVFLASVHIVISKVSTCDVKNDSFYDTGIRPNMSKEMLKENALSKDIAPTFFWEGLLVATPTTIFLLGQIMVYGSKQDFPLTSPNLIANFTFIQFPNSFRATMTQLGNEGLKAFRNADGNMRQMSLALKQVPLKVRDAIDIIENVEIKLVPSTVKVPMRSILRFTEMCLSLAQETEKAFNQFENLLLELLTVTQMKQGEEQKRLKEVQLQVAAKRREQNMINQILLEAEVEAKNAEKDMNESLKAYRKAADSIPSSWTLFFQEMGRGLMEIVKLKYTLPAQIIGTVGTVINGGNSSSNMRQQLAEQQGIDAVFTVTNVLESCDDFITSFLKDMKEMIKLAANASDVRSAASALTEIVADSEKQIIRAKVMPIAAQLKIRAAEALRNVKLALKSLEALKDDQKPEKIINQQIKQLDMLQSKIHNILVEASRIDVQPKQGATPAPAPTEAPEKVTPEERKANIEFKNLQRSQQRAKDARSSLNMFRFNSTEIFNQLASLDTTKLELEDIIKLLKNTVPILQLIKNEWTKLVQFFQTLTMITKTNLEADVKEFQDYIMNAIVENINNKLINDTGSIAYLTTKLKCNEFSILQASRYLFTMASTYVAVSETYIMPRIASVTGLLNIQDDISRNRELENQKREATNTVEHVKKIVNNQYQAYDDWIQEEMKKITNQKTKQKKLKRQEISIKNKFRLH